MGIGGTIVLEIEGTDETDVLLDESSKGAVSTDNGTRPESGGAEQEGVGGGPKRASLSLLWKRYMSCGHATTFLLLLQRSAHRIVAPLGGEGVHAVHHLGRARKVPRKAREGVVHRVCQHVQSYWARQVDS